MTNKELEDEIKCIIENVYKVKFIGKLKVIHKPGSTNLSIGIHSMDKPIFLGADLENEDFLNFICKELKTNRLVRAQFFKGYKVLDRDYDCPIDKSCDCLCQERN